MTQVKLTPALGIHRVLSSTQHLSKTICCNVLDWPHKTQWAFLQMLAMAFSIPHAQMWEPESPREQQHLRITAGRAEVPGEGQDKEAGWGEEWM